MDALELMRLYIVTANRINDRGQLLETNDGLGSPSPRVFFGQTIDGACWYCRHDLASTVADAVDGLLATEGEAESLATGPLCQDDLVKVLGAEDDEMHVESGPFYWFRDPVVPIGQTTQLKAEEAGLLTGELQSWNDAVPFYRPFVASFEVRDVAAICASVRSTSSAHIAGCETESKYRRRGHALNVVSAWARAVQDLDAIAFYNTDWSNVASRHTAVAAGAVQFGVAVAVF